MCKRCNGLSFVKVWQQTYQKGSLQPLKRDPENKGKYLNGRLLARSCPKCNEGAGAQILWQGDEWEDVSIKQSEE